MPTLKQFPKNRLSTVDWLCYHYDKTTGEPFLTDTHQYVAEKFSILCEKMISNYRLSHWQNYVDSGHVNNDVPLHGNARQTLYKALQTLGDDAVFTADIVLKNYTLPMAEKKHNMGRGKAKRKLREALDKLADILGVHDSFRRDFQLFD